MEFSYLLLQKEIFSGQIFFWTSSNEGEFPRGYLINAAACIFAQHTLKQTLSSGQKSVKISYFILIKFLRHCRKNKVFH